MINFHFNELGVPLRSQSFKCFDPVSAAIVAGGSLVTGLVGSLFGKSNNSANIAAQRDANAANLQMTRETNQSNTAINERNIEAQLQLQREQNAWNSETAQAARLRAAGLNPAVVGLGNGSSSSAPSVPSSIPMQSGHVDPVMSNSDTYVQPMLQSFSNAGEVFARWNEGLHTALGNQYDAETMKQRIEQQQVALQRAYVELDNAKIDGDVKRQLKELYKSQYDSSEFALSLNKDSREDMLKARHLQNVYMNAQTKQAFEASRLMAQQSVSEELNRILAQHADTRMNRIANAEIQNLIASAYNLTQSGNVSKQTWQEMRNTFDDRINGLRLNNKLTDAQRLNLKSLRDKIFAEIGLLEQQSAYAEHQNDSYWLDRGFSWFGQFSQGVRDIGIGLGSLKGFNFGGNKTTNNYHIQDNTNPKSDNTLSPQEYYEMMKKKDPNWQPSNPWLFGH